MMDAPLRIHVDIRCAYCGLDHKILVKVFPTSEPTPVVTVCAESEGCDVLNWTYENVQRFNN